MRKATTASFGRFQLSPKPPQVKESRYCAQLWVRESDSLDIEIIEAIADGIDTISALSDYLEVRRESLYSRVKDLVESEVLDIDESKPPRYSIHPVPAIKPAICKK